MASFDAALNAGRKAECLARIRALTVALDAPHDVLPTWARGAGLKDAAPRGSGQPLWAAVLYKQRVFRGPSNGPSTAARVYLAEALRGRHQALLRACVAGGDASAAVGYLRLLPPDGKFASSLLKEAAASGSLEVMRAILEDGYVAERVPAAYCHTALLTCCRHAGNAAAAAAALEAAWGAGVRSVAVCNAAIEALGVCGDAQGAWRVRTRMKASGLGLETQTCNALIRAAARDAALAQCARDLYSHMRSRGPVPDALTLSALFDAAARWGAPDAAWLLDVLADAKASGVQTNSRVLFMLLQAACGASLSQPLLTAVFAEVAAMRARSPPDRSVYSALLKLCAAAGVPERAAEFWPQALEDHRVPDSHMYLELFRCCAASPTPKLLDIAAAAGAQMKRAWSKACSGAQRPANEEEGQRRAMNALMNVYAAAGDAAAAAGLLANMQRQGPSPSAISYNTIIAAHAQAGDVARAFRAFRAMRAAQLAPCGATYGALLHACGKAGDTAGAERLFREMRAAGVPQGVLIYTSLMHACVTCGTPESLARAFEVLDEMEAASVAPTAVTYGCALSACERLCQVPDRGPWAVQRAFELYRQACNRGVTPTDGCHNVLIRICTATGQLDEALELVKELARAHRSMQADTLNSVVRALAPASVLRALRMRSLVRTLGLPVFADTDAVLVGTAARSGLSAEAADLYWQARQDGAEPSRAAGSDLIIALCKASQPREALRVLEDMTAADAAAEDRFGSSGAGARGAFAEAAIGRRRVGRGAAPVLQRPRSSGSQSGTSGLQWDKLVPHLTAIGALVHSFACSGDLDTAFRLYRQVRDDPEGAAAMTLTHRPMFQALIEAACRSDSTACALKVFDDWKAFAARAAKGAGDGEPVQEPRLSNVTLAYLEACCREEAAFEWRVYDVCAAMRQQSERRRQSRLAHPRKQSHHFLDVDGWQEAEDTVPAPSPISDRHAALRARLLARQEEERERGRRQDGQDTASGRGPRVDRGGGGGKAFAAAGSGYSDPEDKWAEFN
ncbi:hypothetical protein WJX81_003174 [Elliptochloris bilobata]|uniref:PROP1-like PPR domain-containing protein n=1 Tax=Elliptochloris bilobata TaxID=381761 RepID=A0AAW1RF05_9CHLO